MPTGLAFDGFIDKAYWLQEVQRYIPFVQERGMYTTDGLPGPHQTVIGLRRSCLQCISIGRKALKAFLKFKGKQTFKSKVS